MGVVIDLESRRPHITEHQECRSCGHKQISVQPDTAESAKQEFWQCSACRAFAAVDVRGLVPHPKNCPCQVCWFFDNYKGPRP